MSLCFNGHLASQLREDADKAGPCPARQITETISMVLDQLALALKTACQSQGFFEANSQFETVLSLCKKVSCVRNEQMQVLHCIHMNLH